MLPGSLPSAGDVVVIKFWFVFIFALSIVMNLLSGVFCTVNSKYSGSFGGLLVPAGLSGIIKHFEL